VSIELDHLLLQFAIEPGHDRDDENEDGDTEGDAENGNQSDDGEEGALWPEITQREEKAEGQFQDSAYRGRNRAVANGNRSGIGPGTQISPNQNPRYFRITGMLWTIAIILLVLWLILWLGVHVASGLIHILIALAIIFAIIALVRRAT
jgi:hypothetical protein